MRNKPSDNADPDWVYDAVVSVGRAKIWDQCGEFELTTDEADEAPHGIDLREMNFPNL